MTENQSGNSDRKAGRGDPIITPEKMVEYLQSKLPPLAGTTQIADHFDVARVSTIERLDTLEERGIVGKRKVGQSYAWYLPEWQEGVTNPNSEKGRPKKVPDSELVAYLESWPKDGQYPSTGTVRDGIDADMNRKAVYRRLEQLEKRGEIESVQVGIGRGKSIGWYATDQSI